MGAVFAGQGGGGRSAKSMAEALARIKINDMLRAAGWRFLTLRNSPFFALRPESREPEPAERRACFVCLMLRIVGAITQTPA